MNNKRLILIILRGGLDGLAAVTPTNDSDFDTYRPGALKQGSHYLTSNFSLHPALSTFKALFDMQQMSFVHSAGLPQSTRSHFWAQDILESGNLISFKTGWLARCLKWQNNRNKMHDTTVIAYGTQRPLILEGYENAFNWSAPKVAQEDQDLIQFLEDNLYSNHPKLKSACTGLAMLTREKNTGESVKQNRKKSSTSKATAFDVIGKIIAATEGPNIGVIPINGWDTHQSQNSNINSSLTDLDAGIAALRSYLEPVWNDSVIIVTTEFGRTVKLNGTAGTDHGTGSVLFTLGGAVNGGKRFGQWPGLAKNALFEGRDVAITNSVFDIFAHIIHAHIGIPENIIREQIFPDITSDFVNMGLVGPQTGAEKSYV